jgi:hypothetical protein
MTWHFSLCVVVPSEWLVSLNWFELVPKDKRKRERLEKLLIVLNFFLAEFGYLGTWGGTSDGC